MHMEVKDTSIFLNRERGGRFLLMLRKSILRSELAKLIRAAGIASEGLIYDALSIGRSSEDVDSFFANPMVS